ncbi:hypothetical protein ANN_10065 [Periplaneta americana]|uniref:Uncharacterized protein n=1 Tax=Periplaneta americana TaxID=6978 RepID=A0ABQ8TQC0_PERAM|nr:hypothetical protein ANN_10065 [Periplaneta americana]
MLSLFQRYLSADPAERSHCYAPSILATRAQFSLDKFIGADTITDKLFFNMFTNGIETFVIPWNRKRGANGCHTLVLIPNGRLLRHRDTKLDPCTEERSSILKDNTNIQGEPTKKMKNRKRIGRNNFKRNLHFTLTKAENITPLGKLYRRITNKLVERALRKEASSVYCRRQDDSTRRIDIVVIDRKKNTVTILDPTIRFERDAQRPKLTDDEKRVIYEICIPCFSEQYNIMGNR